MTRRKLLRLASLAAIASEMTGQVSDAAGPQRVTLLTAPLEVKGDWNGSSPNDALAVIARARQACLGGIRLLSDQQPARLRIDDHRSGPPYVWLHSDQPDTAWVIVDIGPRDWSRLAYQFGHELGHVMANSWRWGDGPKPPSQWLEESVVEAFSIRGLALLADGWQVNPPFPHDSAFAAAIRRYRANVLDGYRQAAAATDLGAWCRAGRPALAAGLRAPEGPAVAPIVAAMESDKGCVEDIGALNRWPERSGLPTEAYLQAWQRSCAEITSPGLLPRKISKMLNLG